MRKLYIATVIVLALLTGCERLLMEPDPSTDTTSVLHEWYKVVRDKYGMFNSANRVKSVYEWDRLYEASKHFLTDNPGELGLFYAIDTMMYELFDGHSWVQDLSTGSGINYGPQFVGYDTICKGTGGSRKCYIEQKWQPVSYDTTEQIISHYITSLTTQTKGLDFGLVKNDTTIGYIRYRDFVAPVSDDDMDEILSSFSQTKGIIFDVRGNGGGDPATADLIASHFMDAPKLSGFEYFKIGPEPDAVKGSPIYTRVAEGRRYMKPVIILVDVGCYSATTTLHYLMRMNNQVKLLGDTTGGGSGSTFDNELANGWIYSLSTSEFVTYDSLHINNGLIPDWVVVDSVFTDGTDDLLDSAIAKIQSW